MKWPTMNEFAQMVADKAIDEIEYNGKTLRQWIEIISATEHGTNLAEVGTDCISRQQAIKAIEEEWDGCCSEYPATQIIYDTTEAIERLPIIQPKKGRWIGKYPITSVCSECGFLIHDSKVKAFAYCPNCGAKMRGEQDG